MACALPPHAPAVPAAIVIRTTSCGYAKVLRNGTVVRWHAPRWPGVARAGEGVWIRHTGGRLTLVRRGRVFWRSGWSRGSDAVYVRGRTIVYAAYPRRYEDSEEVWLARVGGGERRIARHEEPLGWTRAGLLLLLKNRAVDVRDGAGRPVRTMHVRQVLFGLHARTLLAVLPDGRLVRTDGASTKTLTRIRNRHYFVSDVLRGGLIVLERPGAVRFLDRSGGRYAFTRVTRRGGSGGTITRLPDGSIAFSVFRMRRHDTIDTVFLLRHGAHVAVPLYSRHLPLSCGHWTSLTYRAGRLLYSSQGRIALIDPTLHRAPIDLTAFADGLGGGETSASWAS